MTELKAAIGPKNTLHDGGAGERVLVG